MLNDNPQDEIAKVKTCESRTKPLRDRFEDDFGLFRLDKFEIPKSEGEWESYTTNKPSADANKIINTLASSDVIIKIALGEENEKQRKDLSKTERFPYGCIALSDSMKGSVPEVLALQPALSFYATVRGWIVIRVCIYEDKGKVIPDIATWDILNTYWISGSRGLLWVCHKRFANKYDVKDQYGIDVTEDDEKGVKIYDVWDSDEEGVIIGDAYVKKDKHGIGHPPVLILPVGSTPLIQGSRHNDTIKNVGESWAVNNRGIYATSSRVKSYFLTMTGRVVNTPLVFEYDSNLGGLPGEIDNPNVKGSVIPIDKAKGQKLTEMVKPEMTRDVYAFLQDVEGELATGGTAPLLYGQQPFPGTAAGTNILVHQSLLNIKPFSNSLEFSYGWLSHELVSQYKSGDFGKLELQGVDGSNRKFKMEVKPEDIDDGWNFEVTLVADMPQDDLANIGMATQAVESKILSHRTSRDKYGMVKDTDLEQKIIDMEDFESITGLKIRRGARILLEDEDDEEGALLALEALEEYKASRQPGVASQPGVTSMPRPSGTTSAVTTVPEKVNKFFGRLRGRG